MFISSRHIFQSFHFIVSTHWIECNQSNRCNQCNILKMWFNETIIHWLWLWEQWNASITCKWSKYLLYALILPLIKCCSQLNGFSGIGKAWDWQGSAQLDSVWLRAACSVKVFIAVLQSLTDRPDQCVSNPTLECKLQVIKYWLHATHAKWILYSQITSEWSYQTHFCCVSNHSIKPVC